MNAESPTNIVEIATEIVAAYVGNNAVPVDALPVLLQNVHTALNRLNNAVVKPELKTEDLKPAVPIKQSVTDDFIICLDDGKRFRSMKRHIAALGMTPAQYRAKWGLNSDYPMAAPSYSAMRSGLAKSLGLGQLRKGKAKAPEAVPVSPEGTAAKSPTRARRKVKEAA